MTQTKNIGFFTRVLDDLPAAARYAAAIEQIKTAESFGIHTAWIAQHHFDPQEGGLPSPFVLLAAAAAQTSSIRLGTGVITLPLESVLRVAEDAGVLDKLSGGRVELGLGTGGTPATFEAFGVSLADKAAIYAAQLDVLRKAFAGGQITESRRLYPAVDDLGQRIWQATFSVEGGRRAGLAGDGLLLSRTQPRPKDRPDLPLHEVQRPIVEAYLAALPQGVPPRILASRSIFVADSRHEAISLAQTGLSRVAAHFRKTGYTLPSDDIHDLIRRLDTHVGTVDDVAASLAEDSVLEFATEVAAQVHSVDPPPEYTLRSIELYATGVAPALGWVSPAPVRAVAGH